MAQIMLINSGVRGQLFEETPYIMTGRDHNDSSRHIAIFYTCHGAAVGGSPGNTLSGSAAFAVALTR
jgi:hypothetical protein